MRRLEQKENEMKLTLLIVTILACCDLHAIGGFRGGGFRSSGFRSYSRPSVYRPPIKTAPTPKVTTPTIKSTSANSSFLTPTNMLMWAPIFLAGQATAKSHPNCKCDENGKPSNCPKEVLCKKQTKEK